MYQIHEQGSVLRLTDGAFIPPDEFNADYAAYLQWLEEGNVPLNADDDRPAIPQEEEQSLAPE